MNPSKLGQGVRQSPPRTDGAVLFLALALLLVLTAGALAMSQTTTLELRMARNSQDATLALQAAEATLLEVEAWLEANDGDPSAKFTEQGDDGLYAAVRYGQRAPWQEAAAWNANGRSSTWAATGVAQTPRSLVEWVATLDYPDPGGDPDAGVIVDVYRVTAMATGASLMTVVRLQSTYARVRGGGGGGMNGRLSWVELES